MPSKEKQHTARELTGSIVEGINNIQSCWIMIFVWSFLRTTQIFYFVCLTSMSFLVIEDIAKLWAQRDLNVKKVKICRHEKDDDAMKLDSNVTNYFITSRKSQIFFFFLFIHVSSTRHISETQTWFFLFYATFVGFFFSVWTVQLKHEKICIESDNNEKLPQLLSDSFLMRFGRQFQVWKFFFFFARPQTTREHIAAFIFAEMKKKNVEKKANEAKIFLGDGETRSNAKILVFIPKSSNNHVFMLFH